MKLWGGEKSHREIFDVEGERAGESIFGVVERGMGTEKERRNRRRRMREYQLTEIEQKKQSIGEDGFARSRVL